MDESDIKSKLMEDLDSQTTERRVPAGQTADIGDRRRNSYLTALNGAMVGRTYRLGPGRHLVGRAVDSDIAIEDDGVSRRHALLVCSSDGSVVVEDLGSTNGTIVDGEKSEVRELQGGERLQFGCDIVFKFEFRDAIEEQFASYLYESSTQDHLTGVYNERFLRDQLRVEFAWHRRHKQPLTLVFIDVDHFKQVNDTYGHLAGDAVLRQVATRCENACRTEDVFARYGGEEFACLLRQTDVDGGAIIAERMRRVVQETPFEYRGHGQTAMIAITVSAGVAQLDEQTTEPELLLEDADRLLYRAKRNGRNRVELSRPADTA